MRSTFASRLVLGFVLAQGLMWVAAQTAAPRQGHRWPTVAMDSDIQARRDLRPANFSARPFMANGAADSVRDFHIVRHDVLVDGPRNEAIFNLWLSEEPDFEAVDEVGRQSHSFQYFVDTPDFAAFYRRLGGGAEQLQPLVLIRGEEIHYNGSLIAREIEPFYDPTTDPASGGWGPVVATMAVKQDRKRVSFSLPLSVFDGQNGSGPWPAPWPFIISSSSTDSAQRPALFRRQPRRWPRLMRRLPSGLRASGLLTQMAIRSLQ